MLRLHYKRKYNKDKWEDAYYRNRSNLNKSMYHLSENALSEVNDALNNPNTDINSMVKLRDFTPKQLVCAELVSN